MVHRDDEVDADFILESGGTDADYQITGLGPYAYVADLTIINEADSFDDITVEDVNNLAASYWERSQDVIAGHYYAVITSDGRYFGKIRPIATPAWGKRARPRK